MRICLPFTVSVLPLTGVVYVKSILGKLLFCVAFLMYTFVFDGVVQHEKKYQYYALYVMMNIVGIMLVYGYILTLRRHEQRQFTLPLYSSQYDYIKKHDRRHVSSDKSLMTYLFPFLQKRGNGNGNGNGKGKNRYGLDAVRVKPI